MYLSLGRAPTASQIKAFVIHWVNYHCDLTCRRGFGRDAREDTGTRAYPPEAQSKVTCSFFKASYHPTVHLASSHPPFIPLLPTIPSEELPETEEPPHGSAGPPLHTDCFIYFKQSVMEKDKTESVENPAPVCEVIFHSL